MGTARLIKVLIKVLTGGEVYMTIHLYTCCNRSCAQLSSAPQGVTAERRLKRVMTERLVNRIGLVEEKHPTVAAKKNPVIRVFFILFYQCMQNA